MGMKTTNKIRVSQKSKAKLETRCKWCGKPFKKRHNRQMYCCEEHKKYSRMEQNRTKRIKHYHKYKNIMPEEQKYGLGSGRLSHHRHNDIEIERRAIIKEMRYLKIR